MIDNQINRFDWWWFTCADINSSNVNIPSPFNWNKTQIELIWTNWIVLKLTSNNENVSRAACMSSSLTNARTLFDSILFQFWRADYDSHLFYQSTTSISSSCCFSNIQIRLSNNQSINIEITSIGVFHRPQCDVWCFFLALL